MTYETVGATILRYFNPARSPFYPIVAAGTIALALSCSGIPPAKWYFVSVPIYVGVAIALAYAFAISPHISSQEHEEQLVFARSTSISVALISLAWTARGTQSNALAFWLTFSVCVAQTFIFLLYVLFRSQSFES